jgi:hypothetical protein
VGEGIYLLDGALIASNYAELWDGSIGIDFRVTELEVVPVRATAWTGTSTDGTSATHAALGSGSGNTGFGFAIQDDSTWIFSASAPNSSARAFYAPSEILTVTSAPEPTTTALLALGLLGAAFAKNHRAH